MGGNASNPAPDRTAGSQSKSVKKEGSLTATPSNNRLHGLRRRQRQTDRQRDRESKREREAGQPAGRDQTRDPWGGRAPAGQTV